MSRKRVVIFISGGGSNMEALIRAAQPADFPAEIVAVFSDKAEAGGLARAQGAGVATQVFKRKDYASKDEHEDAILEALAALQPDIICLAGYMRLLSGRFIAPYEGRILNIHPSLLPLFPGLHTHQRALDAGMKVAGCTVHLVTEGMDEGQSWRRPQCRCAPEMMLKHLQRASSRPSTSFMPPPFANSPPERQGIGQRFRQIA